MIMEKLGMYFYTVYLVLMISMHVAEAIETEYMDAACGQILYITSSEQVRLRLTSSEGYGSNMDCSFTIVSGLFGSNLMMQFKKLDIRKSDKCRGDRLSLIDGRHLYGRHIGQQYFCGYSTPSTIYNTSSDTLTLHFVSRMLLSEYSGFEIIITQYSTGECYSWDIKCDNGRCVDEDLSCNGYNPCGDYSDCPLSREAIIGIVSGSFALLAVVIVIISIMIRRRRRTGHRTRTHRAPVATIATVSDHSILAPPPYSQVAT